MSRSVSVSIEGGVADVRLNRPDKLNALNQHLMAGLVEAGETLAADPSVRAVVLSGEGRGFCSGLDFSAFQMMAGDAPAESAGPTELQADVAEASGEAVDVSAGIMSTDGRDTHLAQESAWTWQRLPVPVIAAISGPCLGGGLQIALGADIRIVAPDAKLSVLEMRWGLIPDMTGTWVLPRLVGDDVARELTFTGRMVSGTEAAAIGLCTRVADDPFAEAMALAAEIAGKSPRAIRQAKRLLQSSVAPGRTPSEHFLDERSTMGSLIGSPDNVEAVGAYFDKRDPVFPDTRD
jgi:enoyl-CoA hydratase/carnithine racemase